MIADCTGDNAGDSVGPTADGFETYGVTGVALIAFLALALEKTPGVAGTLIVWLFAMRILMIITSLVSYAMNDRYAHSRYGNTADFNPEAPLTSLVWITSILSIGVTFLASDLLLGDFQGSGALWWVLSIIISCGTLAGAIIPEFTKIFTSPHSRHVQEVVNASKHGGASLNVLSADNQDRPWIRTNVDGSPDRVYVYFNGKWVSPHPITASSSYRAIWVGSLANLYSFDGGDGVDPTVTAPTTTTGAMWEEDQDFRDKLPMGVLAATGQVATVGATAGALNQSITLAVANIPRHRHEIAIDNGEAEATGAAYDPDGTGHLDADSGTDTIWQPDSTNEVAYTRYYGQAAPDAITVATVPPVRGVSSPAPSASRRAGPRR